MVQISSPIRWGILGTGAIAHEFVYGLSLLADAQLLAVGSRTEASAQAFAQAYQIPKAYSSYQALVEDPELDVIYVATPHFRHKQDCLLCLAAGKAVLCEKPLALNASEASEVVEAARRQQVFCMEAMWMRFMPLIQRVEQLIANGDIGDVLMFTAEFGYPTEFDSDNRFFNLKLGGGALLDRGSYPLSLAFQLLGKPLAVTGQACMGKTGVDEQLAVVLTYPDGQLAVLSATLRAYSSNLATITGTQGKIVIHPPFCRPDRISITPLSGEPVVSTSKAPVVASPLKRKLTGLVKQTPLVRSVVEGLRDKTQTISQSITGNGFNYEAAEVMNCLRQGKLESTQMPLDESIQILAVMDDLRRQWNLRYPQDEEELG